MKFSFSNHDLPHGSGSIIAFGPNDYLRAEVWDMSDGTLPANYEPMMLAIWREPEISASYTGQFVPYTPPGKPWHPSDPPCVHGCVGPPPEPPPMPTPEPGTFAILGACLILLLLLRRDSRVVR